MKSWDILKRKMVFVLGGLKQLVKSAVGGGLMIGVTLAGVGLYDVFAIGSTEMVVTGWIMFVCGLALAALLSHAAWRNGRAVRRALERLAVKGASRA